MMFLSKLLCYLCFHKNWNVLSPYHDHKMMQIYGNKQSTQCRVWLHGVVQMWPKSIILWMNTCNCFLFNSLPSSTPHPLRCHIILQHNIFLLAFVCFASYWPWERINRCAWLEILARLVMRRIFRYSKRRSCTAFLISNWVVVQCQPQQLSQIWLSEMYELMPIQGRWAESTERYGLDYFRKNRLKKNYRS